MALFKPQTNVGRFDADLVGNHLNVTVKVFIKTVTKIGDTPITDEDCDDFEDEFSALIPQHWEGKFGFKRNNTIVEPKFVVQFLTDPGSAHFVLNLIPGSGTELVSRSPYQPLSSLGDAAPRTANFYPSSTRPSETHTNITYDMGRFFPYYVDTFNGELSPQTKNLISKFMGQIAEANSTIRLYVTGYGRKKETAQQEVMRIMRSTGLLNVVARQSKKRLNPLRLLKKSTSKASQREDYIKISLKEDLPANLFTQSRLFKYPATVVHEFGHMLGLVDEYSCLARRASQCMVDLNIIESDEQLVYENLNFKGSQAVSDNVAQSQENYIRMCKRANVNPSHFGVQTSSIMSSGSEFSECHFVTLWDALTQLSGHDDWEIIKL